MRKIGLALGFALLDANTWDGWGRLNFSRRQRL
jgi:hypothetical protein